jgi:hypothetical protein
MSEANPSRAHVTCGPLKEFEEYRWPINACFSIYLASGDRVTKPAPFQNKK